MAQSFSQIFFTFQKLKAGDKYTTNFLPIINIVYKPSNLIEIELIYPFPGLFQSSSQITKYLAGSSSWIFWYPARSFDIELELKGNIMLIGIMLQWYICHQTEVFGRWQNIVLRRSRGPIFFHLPKTEVWWQIYNNNFMPISNIIF